MRYFSTVEPEEALNKMLEISKKMNIAVEKVNLSDSLGRILAEDLYCPYDLPAFNRSTVDGYAVKATDTIGASTSIPTMLKYAGEIPMGEEAKLVLKTGEAIYVPTGGMIPEGADAMVMIENAEIMDNLILIKSYPSVHQNMVLTGEDVKKDELILKKSILIGPEEIGTMAAFSYFNIPVIKKPRVSIISTGDEIVSADEKLEFGKIRDINTYTIEALAKEAGAEISLKILVKDEKEKLIEIVKEAAEVSDFVLISGGSSVGTKDYTQDAIKALSGELLFHGINIKPGKPTLAGFANGKWIIGLPGHPISAILVFQNLIGKLFEGIYGSVKNKLIVEAIIDENTASSPGRLTIQSVNLEKRDGKIYAKPYYGSSAFITDLIRTDGYIKIPKEVEGLYKGDKVEVIIRK